jgi:hypothetical protein
LSAVVGLEHWWQRYLAASLRELARSVIWMTNAVFLLADHARGQSGMSEPRRLHCDLLREVFANPLRPVAINPTWLSWNSAAVPAIARHFYDDRAFHDLPILADALEEAGCTVADLLDHCRDPGPHGRGCWAVDLLLGKG